MGASGSILVLTGAGVSAESGLATFRGAGGLWEGLRAEEVATPEAYATDPDLVHRFYSARRQQLLGVEPNRAHHALAELERQHPGDVLIVTQNVDDLHERAGSRALLHMHGELLKSRCTGCGRVARCNHDLDRTSRCVDCGRRGTLRPHIVWFGEIPFFMDEIETHLRQADLFVAVGTSGQVYPAAGFVQIAAQFGARTIEVNLEPTGARGQFETTVTGRASEVLPDLVQAILTGEA